MCIMEVRAGQRSDTIAQALAHNVSTIERDLDMFEVLLKAREDYECLKTVMRAHESLKRAYADLLMQFGIELAKHVEDHEGHVHQHNGSERTFVEEAHHSAQLARRYETR